MALSTSPRPQLTVTWGHGIVARWFTTDEQRAHGELVASHAQLRSVLVVCRMRLRVTFVVIVKFSSFVKQLAVDEVAMNSVPLILRSDIIFNHIFTRLWICGDIFHGKLIMDLDRYFLTLIYAADSLYRRWQVWNICGGSRRSAPALFRRHLATSSSEAENVAVMYCSLSDYCNHRLWTRLYVVGGRCKPHNVDDK